MTSHKKLIVNADDFGQSPGINDGIIKAHEKGIVTSASLMVRYPYAKYAAEYAKGNLGLGIGLHIDLGEWIFKNEEWEPLYEVVLLNNESAVKNEINKQLEEFIKIMGRLPTHIDSHQHVHKNEAVLPFCIDLAKELDVTLRACSNKVNYCGLFYGQYNDGSPFHHAISVEGLKSTLLKLPDGITELACHPGLNDDVDTMYRTEREKEVSTLCDESIHEAILRSNIELCSFTGIAF